MTNCQLLLVTHFGHIEKKMKEGASVLGAELTESIAVSPLESDVYVPFIIPMSSIVDMKLVARKENKTFVGIFGTLDNKFEV